MALRTPSGLGSGGKALWVAVTTEHDIDVPQQMQLLEACRAKDRLDKFDQLLRGDIETWMTLTHRLQTEDYELVIDKALEKANQTATLMKQLLAALRLPDEATGKRPARPSAPRGAYSPTGAVAKVSPLERARAARSS